MKVNKKTSVEGEWGKAGKNIKDGDRLKILDAGNIIEGDFGPRKVFKILTTKREELLLSFNQTSLNNLVDGFGEETESWVSKVVSVFVVKQMVGDGLKNVIYLAPEGWEMDDEGKFSDPEKGEPKPPQDDINPSDIPF